MEEEKIMHPTQVAMEKLKDAGFITKLADIDDRCDSFDPFTDAWDEEPYTSYGVTNEQAERLLPLLKRPGSWEESPILKECISSLQSLREQAIENGDIEE